MTWIADVRSWADGHGGEWLAVNAALCSGAFAEEVHLADFLRELTVL